MKRFSFQFLLILAVSLFSCSDTSNNTASENYINPDKEIGIENKEFDAKVVELGDFVSKAINDGNVDGFMSKFDIDYFANKVINSLNLSGTKKANLTSGIKTGIVNVPTELISQVNNGAFYEFVNYRYDSTRSAYFMLFRLYSESNGVNYHDCRVSRIDDELMMNDMYVYVTGENLSKTMNRLMLSGIPSNKLMSLLKPEKQADFKKIVEASNLMRSGQFEESYSMYNSVTGTMKNEKFAIIMKGQVAQMFDEDLYLKAMEELKTKHSDDKTISFNLIDYYLLKEDYDMALETIENLKVETQDDFLEYLLGNINFTKGDYSTAKSNFEYIMKNYEEYHSSYFSYISCLTKLEDYDGVVEMLGKLQTMDYTKSDLDEYIVSTEVGAVNDFEGFIKSTQYHNWKK